ncbi:hypothetical protein [Acidisoma sp. 7E03]
MTAEDIRRLRDTPAAAEAALNAMDEADRAALAARLDALVSAAERENAVIRGENRMLEIALDVHRDAHQSGLIEGLKQAIAAGGSALPPKLLAHPDAAVPWMSFQDQFLASRGELSDGTLKTYRQFFRDLETAIGVKNLGDLTTRDIAKYGDLVGEKGE